MKTKQVIVIRKDLNMRKGKMVAQGAHASMAALLNKMNKVDSLDLSAVDKQYIDLTPVLEDWMNGSFTKICVSVDSEDELISIYKKAVESNLMCSLIEDSGRTEFNGVPTYTAVAVGPGEIEDIDLITGSLALL